MINLINGSLHDPQEKIQWTKNKSSATVILNTHPWRIGETLIVGYGEEEEIIIGIGIKRGVGPDCYRVIVDKSVIIVTEVLNHTPDVSYYAFDQRYLVRENEGNLNLTLRYIDPITEEVKVEKTDIEKRCIVVEAVTGDIWICDPPVIINFFDVAARPDINIEELGDGQIKLELTSHGKTWRDLCFIGPSEKAYLTEMVFDKNFEITIIGQKFNSFGSPVASADPCLIAETIYTLNSKYYGVDVDLDEIPKGWTRIKEGLYSKTIIGNLSSSSGQVTCKYTTSGYTGTKIAKSVSVIINKYIFILYSPNEIDRIEEADKIFLSSTPSLGKVSVTPPQNSYVWMAFPTTMKPSQITQLGVNYVSQGTKIISGVKKSGVVLGDYIIYRSLNPGNGQTQDIDIK